MNNYIITTDTTTDLPEDYIKKHDLGIMSLTYTLEGTTYSKDNPLDVRLFYEKMRNGSMPTTSQVNPENAKNIFLPYLKDGYDILHIAFSSGLSGSYNSTRIAAEELSEEFPDRKITIIDSLAASLGEGLLVHKAVMLKEQGADLDTVADWVEQNKLHIVHNFTVDDLFHLHRGGRVSKATAILGTMINVKPILHVDDEGHLIALSKVRGRKKSLQALVDSMEKQMGAYRSQNDIVFISHGDSLADAQYVADLVKQRFGIESFLINYVGPTIGAHSGPGTIALFYMGDYR
ncbi:DegV family protein [Roseburia sp. BX1005]|uniref:DegV family protein n=1 Tax=Roseburia zhanii TaxID=2763064 RepID=A0A923LRF3_9FIRM|nr:DegV family protein [Roseburia zhanii]MBC5714694.1 DegV family protein [Roseburia zhanii]OLA91906.1 MAG: fatty acid-binding protein DegV [Roseburia sp. 40_7]